MASRQPDSEHTHRAWASISAQDFIAEMWRGIETPEGAAIDIYFVPKGRFQIEGYLDACGVEQLNAISAFRQRLGQGGKRYSRHLMTNYSFDYGQLLSAGELALVAVMLHYGGSGHLPLPLEQPLAIYDIAATLVRSDARWLVKQWRMTAVFMAENHPTRSMAASVLPATSTSG